MLSLSLSLSHTINQITEEQHIRGGQKSLENFGNFNVLQSTPDNSMYIEKDKIDYIKRLETFLCIIFNLFFVPLSVFVLLFLCRFNH